MGYHGLCEQPENEVYPLIYGDFTTENDEKQQKRVGFG